MKKIFIKRNVIIAIAIVIGIAVCGILYSQSSQNTNLKKSLSAEKERTEYLLSQKMQLDESLKLSKKDVSELKGKNNSLETMITETNRKIVQKNAEINQLRAQNASVKDLEKKIGELESLKNQLNSEIAGLNKSLAKAKADNLKLNDKIASAARTNKELSSDNSILSSLLSDNYRVEALRGKNEKLTVLARRTDKLLVSFDLPDNIVSNDVYFQIMTPQGEEYSSNKDLATSINFYENPEGLIASTDQSDFGYSWNRRIEMSYMPKQKLTRGIYQFNLYNQDRFLGSFQLRLK